MINGFESCLRFDFKFNMRRYTEGGASGSGAAEDGAASGGALVDAGMSALAAGAYTRQRFRST
jgi:hypothetical protein